MKPNLLPNLSSIELFDKAGQTVALHVRLYQHAGRYALFMADAPGEAVMARNAATLISQLVQRLELPREITSFYRHIYLPHAGSVFGTFQVGWSGAQANSYTFAMLTPGLDDQGVRRILAEGSNLPIGYGKLRNLAPAI